ncbi:MAG TPA: FtsX-like permease family protein, partial [Fusibacter sp.]|nr:FtsX-like permease family protein [Fusibacter sp.]
FSMYAGLGDVLKERYPNDVMVRTYDVSEPNIGAIRTVIDETAKKHQVKIDDMMGYRFTSLFSTLEENRFTVNKAFNMTSSDYFFILVPLEDYNAIYGEAIVLKDDEALLFSNTKNYGKMDLTLGDMTFRIVKELDTFADIEKKKIPMSKDYILIVNDPNALYTSLLPGEDSEISYVTMFDTSSNDERGLSEKDYLSFEYDLSNAVERNISDAYMESRLMSRDGFYTLYGGMFFIGLFLGTLFLMATVMIIYYKQISEGYDDKARFEIMQKVGMSEQEIKRSIRTQIVMVFFLPLVFAIIHIGFAFEVIIRLLAVFNFVNVSPFFLCTVGIILAFAIIYFIVYFITARAYLRIVK